MARKDPHIDMLSTLSTVIQEAIRKTPGVMALSEEAYCEIVLDALEVLSVGLKMRLEEIRADQEE